MGIDEYRVPNDKFEHEICNGLDFPCDCCKHRHGTDIEEPCLSCGHNLNSTCEDDTETIVVLGKCDECGCAVDPDNIGFESERFCICRKCDERTHELWEEFKLTDTYKHELENGKQIEDLIDWN